jgi:uncharacterized membrane protein YfhO
VITRDADALPLARVEPRGAAAGAAPQPARITRREPDRVEITTGGAAGLLVLADSAYPGWHVSVDGHAAHGTTAHSLFRAVEVGDGVHHVVWTFRPLTLRLGFWISVLTLVLLTGVAIGWPRLRSRAHV